MLGLVNLIHRLFVLYQEHKGHPWRLLFGVLTVTTVQKLDGVVV